MIINPTDEYARFELARIRWFLGNVDLTIVETAGVHIQDAYYCIIRAQSALEDHKK